MLKGIDCGGWHKACRDQLQDPELVSLESRNFERSMMAILKYLEEGLNYSVTLQNGFQGQKLWETTLTFRFLMTFRLFRSGIVCLPFSAVNIIFFKLWQRQTSLRRCGGNFHIRCRKMTFQFSFKFKNLSFCKKLNLLKWCIF